MTFLVYWSHEAFQQLAAIVAGADDPQRIQTASDWIDYALRRVPLDVGEDRRPGYRLWYSDVLGVYYRVDRDANTVYIASVGLSRRPRR